MAPYATRAGTRFPPGATVADDGVNFCIFSRHATRVELLLYAAASSPEPFQLITLTAEHNRTFFFWHVFVEGLPPRTCYTWRMDGPQDTSQTGRSFNPRKELLDPWARAVTDALWDRNRAADPQDDGHASLRAIVTDDAAATRPGRPARARWRNHLRASRRRLHAPPSSGVQHPGTFAGLIEKIPYLARARRDPRRVAAGDGVRRAGRARRPLLRGGCATTGATPATASTARTRAIASIRRALPHEFRALTDALHGAGIGVLLDVVFNHTAEGDAAGPVINFKGLANDIFYHLEAARPASLSRLHGMRQHGQLQPSAGDRVHRATASNTGWRSWEWTVFASTSPACLRVTSAVELMADPPLPWAIESSRVLSRVPLIAEAWDAAGLYHVGAFPGMAWAEWNGRYRDVVRRFVRGDPGLVGEVATRIAGSADLYAADGRLPGNSINFITCHDGFTLQDLVSYNAKHNDANGEDNRDGSDDNASWNCGVEGETSDPEVLALRRRQARNHLAILMLSRGVPMLLAGDEVLRSQDGNNNAWCQDNPLSWFDWTLVECIATCCVLRAS